jgi:hypothetical protein
VAYGEFIPMLLFRFFAFTAFIEVGWFLFGMTERNGLDWMGRYHSIIGIAIGVDEYLILSIFTVYIAEEILVFSKFKRSICNGLEISILFIFVDV